MRLLTRRGAVWTQSAALRPPALREPALAVGANPHVVAWGRAASSSAPAPPSPPSPPSVSPPSVSPPSVSPLSSPSALSGLRPVVARADAPTERIAKFIARHSSHSRREVERLLGDGKVTVNGSVVLHPATFVGPADDVRLAGRRIRGSTATDLPRLFVAHKLPGELVTWNDPQGRPTLFQRLAAMGLPAGLRAVGRLDFNSEGLLLLSNDGEFARFLEHPRSRFERVYRVRVFGRLEANMLASMRRGMEVGGERFAPIRVTVLSDRFVARHEDRDQDARGSTNVWLRMTLTEGKNREIRRIFEHFRLTVNRLIRTQYGPFELGKLPRGAVTEVRPPESLVSRARVFAGKPPLPRSPDRRFRTRAGRLGAEDGAGQGGAGGDDDAEWSSEEAEVLGPETETVEDVERV